MAKSARLVPKRRFKEFQNSDAWEQRKLEDIADIIGGGTPSTSNVEYWDGNIDWYAPAEIDDQIYASGSVRKITEQGLKNSSAKILPANKTILFTSRAGIGKTAILSHSGATNQGFQSLVLKDGFNPYFVYSMSNQIKEKAEAIASGSTFLEISGKMLGKLEIMVPDKIEQDEIAKLFKNLDNLITLHQRKLEKTKALKAAFLSEMFPFEGQHEPKRRFIGFTGAWEQCKFKDIAEFNPKSEIPETFEYVDLESVVGTEMIAHRAVNKSNAPSRAQRLAKQGDLFYQTVRPYQKNNYLYDKAYDNYVFSTGYAQIRPKVEGHFLLSYVQTNSFVDEIMSRCTGTSYPAISSSDMEDMIISVPIDKGEQMKISRFLMNLDNLITLHHRKLEKLQNIKKAYLNEMFI